MRYFRAYYKIYGGNMTVDIAAKDILHATDKLAVRFRREETFESITKVEEIEKYESTVFPIERYE